MAIPLIWLAAKAALGALHGAATGVAHAGGTHVVANVTTVKGVTVPAAHGAVHGVGNAVALEGAKHVMASGAMDNIGALGSHASLHAIAPHAVAPLAKTHGTAVHAGRMLEDVALAAPFAVANSRIDKMIKAQETASGGRTKVGRAARPNGRAAPGATTARVRKALSGGVAMTAGEVAAATGLQRGTVSATLSRMAKRGELLKAERGYRLLASSS